MSEKETDIRDLTLEEMQALFEELGEQPFRAKQVWKWLYEKGASSWEEMTDLSKGLREKLARRYRIGRLELLTRQVSNDGTEKYLLRLHDGNAIESVLIPSGRRLTQCISSQVGCGFGCLYCASGKGGYVRDLGPGEIAGQVMFTAFELMRGPTNIVLMGIGEPFDNFDNVEKALRIMNSPEGLQIGARKITVSTCGIIPGIRRFEGIGLQVELSVSLHAPDDELRTELMPVNRKYPLRDLIEACNGYADRTGRQVTFEYLMIEGTNDSMTHADRLARLLKGFLSKVNLITMNEVPGAGLRGSDAETVQQFCDRLAGKGIPATIRRSRGADIMAACGQLRLASEFQT
jgi:23S rRNA (adenine2503-C2)-methyltransferase